jgi:hypothetical protein
LPAHPSKAKRGALSVVAAVFPFAQSTKERELFDSVLLRAVGRLWTASIPSLKAICL